jgi:hypothetical protein
VLLQDLHDLGGIVYKIHWIASRDLETIKHVLSLSTYERDATSNTTATTATASQVDQ